MVVLISCDKKDDPVPEVSIVGKWEVTDATVKLLVNETPLKDYLVAHGSSTQEAQQSFDEIAGPVDPADVFKGTVYEFKEDGKLAVTSDAGVDTGTWALSDDKKGLLVTYDADPPGTVYLPQTILTLANTELKLDVDLGQTTSEEIAVHYFITMMYKRL